MSKTVKYYFANKQRMAENSSTSGVRYYSKDHLGSSSAITDAVGNLVLRTVNAPYGSEVYNQGSGDVSYKFTDKEKDNTGLNYFGARFYDPEMGRFISVDPAKDGWNWYAYCNGNPVKLVDLNGKQPVKAQSGTANRFAEEMNNSPSKIGTTTGVAGMNALVYLGSSNGFDPVATPYFNMSSNRYVYTTSGGWIDMVHFLYYAGIAENNKITGAVNPVRSAVDTGKFQELIDQIKAPWSSYSYEDLPSDFFGANFAVNFYDPNSSLTLSGQIISYLNMLGATDPQIAPNWELMPESDSKNPPMATNNTTDPMFTLDDGDADN